MITVLQILAAVVGLGVLIIIHEGGHFLVARWCGMRVDRFSIGFGPALAKFQRGETTYQIGLIPLGGFVQIAGLNTEDSERGTIAVEKNGRLEMVERAADDARLFPNRPVYQRMLTIAAGPGTNYAFAALWIAGVFMLFGEPVPGKLPVVDELIVGRPAEAAGLQLQDEIVSVDGQTVKDRDALIGLIRGSNGRPVNVVVSRAGSPRSYSVTPVQSDGNWVIGVQLSTRQEWAPVSTGTALVDGLVFPFRATPMILRELGKLVRNFSPAKMSGPLGMVRVLRSELTHGLADFLATVGSLSIGLGLFNLLPLPALDGGRLIFLGYEAVLRRKFPERLEQRVHLVGLLALLSLILIITGYDIARMIH